MSGLLFMPYHSLFSRPSETSLEHVHEACNGLAEVSNNPRVNNLNMSLTKYRHRGLFRDAKQNRDTNRVEDEGILHLRQSAGVEGPSNFWYSS